MDAGYAKLLKSSVNQEHTAWLDDDTNADKRYGGKFTAKEQRILITHWVGNTYQKLIGPAYDNFRWPMFQKTGCLITANGEEDNLFQPEGLENYKVPPPGEFIEPLSTNPEQPTAATIEEEPSDVQIIGDDEEVQDMKIEVESILDNVEDRSEDDELIGRELKALYENGWYKVEIRYFNLRIEKYKVQFSDEDKDFVGIEEIDGVEIVLL